MLAREHPVSVLCAAMLQQPSGPVRKLEAKNQSAFLQPFDLGQDVSQSMVVALLLHSTSQHEASPV
jgi:hypothetical protein